MLVAVLLSIWRSRQAIPPSPIFDWGSTYFIDDVDPIDKVLSIVVPKAMVAALVAAESGRDATARSGRWYTKKHALLHCSQRFADQMMRNLRTEVRLYVEKAGVEVTEGGEIITQSRLTAFDLSYAYGVNKGVVKVAIKPGDSLVIHSRPPQRPEDIDPDWRPPFFQLLWDIEEHAGPQRGQ